MNCCDILGRGADQRGGGGAAALVLEGAEARVEFPGPALARDPRAPGLLYREGQRRPGGGVEVGDIAGDVEKMALGGEHAAILRG